MKIGIYGSRENMHQRSLTVVHIISRTLYLTACCKIFHLFGFQTLAKKKNPISARPYPSSSLLIVGLIMYHITRVTTYIHYRIFIVVYGNARLLSVLPELIARGMKTPNSLRTVHVYDPTMLSLLCFFALC